MAISLICIFSIVLCSCSDVTVSQDSSLSKNDTTTPAKTSLTDTKSSTVATTVKIVTTSATTAATTTETTLPETTAVATEPKPAPTDSPKTSETAPQAKPTASTDFDTSFFDDALFIGDSITTGLYLYGYLDESLVYAKLGLAPSTALESEIDGVTINSKIKANNPKRYILCSAPTA